MIGFRQASMIAVTALFSIGILAYALRWLWIAMIAVALLLQAYSAAKAEELIEPTPEEYADIQKWISSTCCWTNHCCFKVKPSAFTAIPSVPFMDEWRVNETGQILKRTGWSRDGQTWRCTCDYVDGKWVAHPRANTRCIFPAQSGS